MKWEKKTLEDLVTLQRGYDLPDSQRILGDVPVIGSAGLTGYHSEAKVKGPCISMGRSGNSIGKLTYTVEDCWPHNASMYVKDLKGNDSRFCYFLLSTINFKGFNSGGAIPSLNRNLIYPIPVVIPPLPTQRKIASILSAYDDLIENNLKRIRLLEEQAFLRYKGMDSFVSTQTLGDILKLNYGKSLSADNRKPGIYPVYGSSGVVGFNENFLVKGPGVIVGRKGNVGTVFWCQTNFFPIDTVYYVESEISFYLLYFNLKHSQHFDNSDAAVPGLNRTSALGNKIHLPSIKEMEAFESYCKPTFDLIFILQKQNAKLREARDILLPRLMSGEVEV